MTEASSLPRCCFAEFIHQIAMQVVCSSALFLNIMQAVFSIALLYSSVSVKQAVFSIALLYSFVTVSVFYKQCSALPCCVCQCYISSVQHCLAVFVSISVMQAVYSIALRCWSTGLYLHLSYNGASGVQHCLAVCLLVCTFICRTALQVVCRIALLCLFAELPSCVCQCYASGVQHCLAVFTHYARLHKQCAPLPYFVK